MAPVYNLCLLLPHTFASETFADLAKVMPLGPVSRCHYTG